jgi:beta-galactosidase/beta-glucuronidase
MKKTISVLLIIILAGGYLSGQAAGWKVAGDKITTQWAGNVDPLNPLPDYPRPQMVRDTWKNLNGLWDYAITPREASKPAVFDGKILVPFAVESALSGVNRNVGPDNILWYRTRFTLPSSFRNRNILLHFGAVDWDSEIWINGTKAGSHSGGYDPFYLDITPFIKGRGAQLLEIRVADPVDRGPQPRGKQVLKPSGIWYTSVTGIWQTVWIEAVPKTFISSLKLVPDIDRQVLAVNVSVTGLVEGDLVKVSALEGGTVVSEKTSAPGAEIMLPVSNPKLWSPASPFLYDMKVSVIRKGKSIDEIGSYFAMRKISVEPDVNGFLRMMLNNSFVFQYGPLDQGWWPDGLYTAPTDEALLFDIVKTKEMGFNMIRKHVKVEPARWYYHCDRQGMLVWQDMPSGDLGGGRWNTNPGMEGGSEKVRTPESEQIFRKEWNAIMEALFNHPSIVVWVPFNEAWGQFKTVEITNWTMQKDPSRLVNSASGGNFHQVGHILDMHNYPGPVMPKPEVFASKQALVLGEFGGLGLPLDGHTWLDKDNWGYRSYPDADTLFRVYDGYLDQIARFVVRGLSAAIYTQTTDVEIEVNGLMTYDRKIIKIPEATLRRSAQKLYDASGKVQFRK